MQADLNRGKAYDVALRLGLPKAKLKKLRPEGDGSAGSEFSQQLLLALEARLRAKLAMSVLKHSAAKARTTDLLLRQAYPPLKLLCNNAAAASMAPRLPVVLLVWRELLVPACQAVCPHVPQPADIGLQGTPMKYAWCLQRLNSVRLNPDSKPLIARHPNEVCKVSTQDMWHRAFSAFVRRRPSAVLASCYPASPNPKLAHTCATYSCRQHAITARALSMWRAFAKYQRSMHAAAAAVAHTLMRRLLWRTMQQWRAWRAHRVWRRQGLHEAGLRTAWRRLGAWQERPVGALEWHNWHNSIRAATSTPKQNHSDALTETRTVHCFICAKIAVKDTVKLFCMLFLGLVQVDFLGLVPVGQPSWALLFAACFVWKCFFLAAPSRLDCYMRVFLFLLLEAAAKTESRRQDMCAAAMHMHCLEQALLLFINIVYGSGGGCGESRKPSPRPACRSHARAPLGGRSLSALEGAASAAPHEADLDGGGSEGAQLFWVQIKLI
eukprot:1157426-Pelagomonas_calceolata.AAC.13